MALDTFNFTTGPASLQDVGVLSYEGCVFSPLFTSELSGSLVKDNARRTVKYIEYTLTVDGYVTLPEGHASIAPTMANLQQLLTRQGGALVYQGRGLDLVVNPAGDGGLRDVAWGPIPELLEFQPLGGGLSAKVRWQCKIHIPAMNASRFALTLGGLSIPLLQFNYESSINYGEDGYSTLNEKGTLEVPLTRSPSQTNRNVPYTADDFRTVIETRIFSRVNLDLFRVTKRHFSLSRDKRTMEWDYTLEEKPYMDLPENCTVARGTFNVRPAKAGMGLCLWLCSLRASYTVRADRNRNWAWRNFLALLRVRMTASVRANVRGINTGRLPPPRAGTSEGLAALLRGESHKEPLYAWLIDFSIDEGLYLESKTTSFSATWRLATQFDRILVASGLWTKAQEKLSRTLPAGAISNNVWTLSMINIMGTRSWRPRKDSIDPSKDIIVDFGSD